MDDIAQTDGASGSESQSCACFGQEDDQVTREQVMWVGRSRLFCKVENKIKE